MRRSSLNTGLRTLALGCTAVLVLLRLGVAFQFVSSGIAAIRYPFELDYGEGVVLNQTRVLMSGDSLYQPIDRVPFAITVYPPLFHVVAGAADLLIGNTLAVGRGVSLASSILAAVMIGILAWQAIGREVAPLARRLAALVAGLGFLNVSYTATWGALMRVDLLAEFLTLCGLVMFVGLAPRSNRACWAAIPFVLAVYTRQSAVAAPVACIIVGLLVRPGLAVRLAASLVGLGLSAFAVINFITNGQFYFQVIRAQQTVYDWHRTLWYLSDLRLRYAVEIAIALVATGSLFRELRRRHAAEALPAKPAPDVNWARPVLGVYLFVAFLVSLTVGKVGSEVNYLIEFMGTTCACVGVALGEALAGVVPGARVPERVSASLSALLLSALLVVPALGLLGQTAMEWVEIPSLDDQHEMERLVELIRQVNGPVLSQSATPVVLAGKAVEYQSCDALGQLAQLGRWDPTPFIDRIERQAYGAIILGFDVTRSRDGGSFTPEMVGAVRREYVREAVIANFWIYKPRQRVS